MRQLAPLYLSQLKDAVLADSQRDYRTAFKIYNDLVGLGCAEAMCNLAFLYDTGRGVERDNVKALSLYANAIEEGHPRAYLTVYFSSPRASHAAAKVLSSQLDTIAQAAHAGNAQAQFIIAMSYRNGILHPKNYETAFEWFRASAENGFPRAQLYLGMCYNYGAGCHKDELEALRLYKNAKDADILHAYTLLAGCYLHSGLIPQDNDKAKYYLEIAAQRGHADAQYNLSLLLLSSKSESDKQYAHKLLNSAFNLGHEAVVKRIRNLSD